MFCNPRHSPFPLVITCIGSGILACSEAHSFTGCQVAPRLIQSGCFSIHSFRSQDSLLPVFVYSWCITAVVSLFMKTICPAKPINGWLRERLWETCLAGLSPWSPPSLLLSPQILVFSIVFNKQWRNCPLLIHSPRLYNVLLAIPSTYCEKEVLALTMSF